jgi:hypothetical protein
MRRPQARQPEIIHIPLDVDCPGCGWPETRAVHVGPTFPNLVRFECARPEPCRWTSVPTRSQQATGQDRTDPNPKGKS